MTLQQQQQQQQQQSLQEAQSEPMTLQQPQQLHLQFQTWSNPPLPQQSQQNPDPALMSTSDEGSAATIAANSNNVCLNADRGMNGSAASEEAAVFTDCSEDVKAPEVFGSFVEQLLDAAAWPEDIAATGMTDDLRSYKAQVCKVACQLG